MIVKNAFQATFYLHFWIICMTQMKTQLKEEAKWISDQKRMIDINPVHK